jgi:energy-coupling factor transport system substrate-specific component
VSRPYPIRWRSALVLTIVSAVGVAAFTWPLFVAPDTGLAHGGDAPWLFALLLPLLLVVCLVELADGRADAKSVAMLGVLAAVGAVLRVLSTGTAGFEPLFFLLIVAGRALGAGFGFALGAVALFASAFVTGGVGPWVPFQMLGCGWVALGAGLLPWARGRAEAVLLAVYGFVAGLLYGLLLNMWFWPFTALGSGVDHVPGDPVIENLGRFFAFHVATSLGWDLPRAVLTAVLCLVAGPPVLAALRRALRRAAFDAPVEFRSAETERNR